MLESLSIRHVALIEEATIHFYRGLQVLTGETGAGKSIVVDSVNLLLGGRGDRDLIRTGEEKASVEAVFRVKDDIGINCFMEKEGIDFDGETITVYRELSTNGKNICRICGVLIPVNKLKELSVFLLDLHGQNDHQFLTDPEQHLIFLDQTGDNEHKTLLQKIHDDYLRFIENHRNYARMIKQNTNREAKMNSLERDIEEIRKADIKQGEANNLLERRKQLEIALKESERLHTVEECFSGGEGINGLTAIKTALEDLKRLSIEDASFAAISERCESLYYELEDIAYQISLKAQNTEFEPDAMEKTEERLDLIHRLERKYHTDADQLPALLLEMETEYKDMSSLDKEIERMSSEHKFLLSEYRKTAKILSESRHRLAEIFVQKLTRELNDLGMGNTRFEVRFIPNETGRPTMPTENGDDKIEFMISANPGEPLKPLAKIASGGELSRLMLAIKTLESNHSGVDAMVFDEIDTGISGRMAQIVSEKMLKISRDRQVLCVTHLPQIAAAADYHYLVRKEVLDGRTITSVEQLDEAGRNHEVSRMISGADGINKLSDDYAATMIQAAEELKRKSDIITI